jgi:hypothetical protein
MKDVLPCIVQLLSDPLSLLYSEYQLLFTREYNSRNVKLNTHLHLVPRLRIFYIATPTAISWLVSY